LVDIIAACDKRLFRRVCAWRGNALNFRSLEWQGKGEGQAGAGDSWENVILFE
jgi:hypothetical protein